MDNHIIISMFISLLLYCKPVYLIEQSNYHKPRLERNNILNKGLWMKDKVPKSNYGDFIFRADSGDVDNLLQNNFDAFGENFMDAIPVFSNYVERNKRSIIDKQNQRFRKNIRKCKDQTDCSKKSDEKESFFKSKFISQLKPSSVFNDYPYEVAILLANSNKREINNYEKLNSEINPINSNEKNLEENPIENKINEQNETEKTDFKLLNKTMTTPYNKTIITIPKRRMTQLEFELEEKNKLPDIEINNRTKYIDGNKINRNVFDKEERIWQNAPIQHMMLPRPESSLKNKPVTEKGLVKVLSLLTKTFRKVMKQHNEIQEIDNKLHSLNEDFMKNIAILDTKFQAFDAKYNNLIEINEQMQRLNEKFVKKNDEIQHKETEISKNLKEFENQQQQFLSQQHQFYTIQKLMLEQNEKINRKQSLIAKTQSEISHRQNHFARVLKKAKQFYMENKFPTDSKLTSILNKPKNSKTMTTDNANNITLTTPATPASTDSVKINLFSIPKISPLLNHDKLILEDKNYQPIDDLVYKYYFNNTFIDRLMKSKVLTAVIDSEAKNTRNAKNKRDDLTKETTILLPVGKTNEFPISHNLHRERRWIRHPNKILGKIHGKDITIIENLRKDVTDIKKSKQLKEYKKDKFDPFLIMATNFCNEVGQNAHEQMLNWCVEKSLRKLKSIDMMISPIKPLAAPPVESISEKDLPFRAMAINSERKTTKLFPLKTSTQAAREMYTSTQPVISIPESLKRSHENDLITEKASNFFFPDNDELESNLKQYELKPDPEGTVYFDGSLHTSDIVISESDALSDIMPGLDSNSRVDVDPLAIDLQARRRAYVRRLNENIMRTMNS